MKARTFVVILSGWALAVTLCIFVGLALVISHLLVNMFVDLLAQVLRLK
jgi:hypothetical protein